MSFSEITVAVGSVAAGVAAGSLVLYFYGRKGSSSPSPERDSTSSSSSSQEAEGNLKTLEFERFPSQEKLPKGVPPNSSQRLIPRGELEKSKRELRTLLLEKELVSAALTRLYEAEAAHEITGEERETLCLKYREELKAIDEKILKIDAFIEIGDLETLREQLLNLVEQKVSAIERRIEKTKLASAPWFVEKLTKSARSQVVENLQHRHDERKKPVPDISDLVVVSSSPPLAPSHPANDDFAEKHSTSTLNVEPTRNAEKELEEEEEEKSVGNQQLVALARHKDSGATTSKQGGGDTSSLPLVEEIELEQNRETPASEESANSPRRRARQGSSATPSSGDDKVEELQKELLEALDRLEKLDVES